MSDHRIVLDEAWYWAPGGTPPPVEEVLIVCEPCLAGLHEQCLGDSESCDCTEGACRGEWVEMGYYTPPDAPPDALGPPLPVQTVERTADGWTVNVSVPADHPAYAALHAGLTDSLSLPDDPAVQLSDNGRSVNSADTRSPVRATFQGVPVASPIVTTGLGREHIETHRHIPGPGRIELPELLGGIPADAPEAQLVRYNRADRRRAAKAARKARRGR